MLTPLPLPPIKTNTMVRACRHTINSCKQVIQDSDHTYLSSMCMGSGLDGLYKIESFVLWHTLWYPLLFNIFKNITIQRTVNFCCLNGNWDLHVCITAPLEFSNQNNIRNNHILYFRGGGVSKFISLYRNVCIVRKKANHAAEKRKVISIDFSAHVNACV